MKFDIEFESNIFYLEYLGNSRHIAVPKWVVDEIGGLQKQRLICNVNGIMEFQCGLMPLGEGAGYIYLNKKRIKELGIDESSVIKIRLREDNSEYGMDMCEELQIILAQDEEVNYKFHKLTKGKQRTLIHYISNFKTSDKRIEKALTMAQHLVNMPDGKLDYKVIYGKKEE